jgi:hypothetical protein
VLFSFDIHYSLFGVLRLNKMLVGLTPKDGHIAVKTHTADVMDQPDLWVFDLDITGFFSKLQYDGAYLRSTSRSDGVALG